MKLRLMEAKAETEKSVEQKTYTTNDHHNVLYPPQTCFFPSYVRICTAIISPLDVSVTYDLQWADIPQWCR